MSQVKNLLQKLTICLLLLLQVSGSWSKDDGRIVNGYEEKIENAPFLVQIYFGTKFKCGGTLIKENIVITAAHCIVKFASREKSLSELIIKAGASKISDTGKSTKVVGLLKPHDFNITAPYDIDIAMLKLKTPLKGALIKPTTPCDRKHKLKGTVKVLGWGFTKDEAGQKPSDQLQAVDLKMVTKSRCRNSFHNFRIESQLSQITDTMFCAAAPGKDACQGDSGGPVIVDGKYCGIVSWSYGCAVPGYPGVYTELKSPRVREFITKALKRLNQA